MNNWLNSWYCYNCSWLSLIVDTSSSCWILTYRWDKFIFVLVSFWGCCRYYLNGASYNSNIPMTTGCKFHSLPEGKRPWSFGVWFNKIDPAICASSWFPLFPFSRKLNDELACYILTVYSLHCLYTLWYQCYVFTVHIYKYTSSLIYSVYPMKYADNFVWPMPSCQRCLSPIRWSLYLLYFAVLYCGCIKCLGDFYVYLPMFFRVASPVPIG